MGGIPRHIAKKFSTQYRSPDKGSNLLTSTSKLDTMATAELAGPDGCAGYDHSPDGVCVICYAMTIQHRWPNVGRALDHRARMREAAVSQGRESPLYRITIESYVKAIVASFEVTPKAKEHFRLFESGDFADHDSVLFWQDVVTEVLQQRPSAKFWVPSRAWNANKKVHPNIHRALDRFAEIPRVVLRDSVLKIVKNRGEVEQGRPNRKFISFVISKDADRQQFQGKDWHVCDAPARHGCNGCLACWVVPNVGYVEHD